VIFVDKFINIIEYYNILQVMDWKDEEESGFYHFKLRDKDFVGGVKRRLDFSRSFLSHWLAKWHPL
jgi:hypothetical protein